MSGYEGTCLCGTVRFTAHPPTLFCVHCHCRYCRRAHGAGVVTWFGVPEDRFEITAGGECLTWYSSSKQSRRGFCASCGTTLFYVSSLSPGEVHIARACVDGPIDRAPHAHVFFDQHVDWLATNDDLRRLGGDSEELAKYKDIEA